MESGALNGFSAAALVTSGSSLRLARLASSASTGTSFLPRLERGRIDDHHWLADRLCILDDIRGTALAPCRLAIPNSDQYVGTVHGFHSAIEIGVLTVAGLADDALKIGCGQRLLDACPFGGRKSLANSAAGAAGWHARTGRAPAPAARIAGPRPRQRTKARSIPLRPLVGGIPVPLESPPQPRQYQRAAGGRRNRRHKRGQLTGVAVGCRHLAGSENHIASQR